MSVDFSVVIPSFRRPKPLGEAIASVLGQPGVSVEVIVIDDSPEASAEGVVAAIGDARVRYLNNPAPSGGWPSSVRNLGWPLAQGDFIHFLDDDDIVPDGHYAAVKKIFAARPDVGVVFGRIEPFGDAPEAQLQQERAFFDDRARRARLCRLFGPRWGFHGLHDVSSHAADLQRRRRAPRMCGAGGRTRRPHPPLARTPPSMPSPCGSREPGSWTRWRCDSG
jgi:glycosyltransferase involved in cell wall biosynthesis